MNKSPAVAIAIIIAILAMLLISRKRSARPAAPPIEKIDAFMTYSAEEAVDVAKNMGIALDYSESSIKRADDALEKLHQEYLKRKSEDGVWGLSIMFGAYGGEVIRRGGATVYWKKDHPTIGENTFPLYWGGEGACVFPVGWCQKRILNGEEDSIVYKLEITRAKRKKN